MLKFSRSLLHHRSLVSLRMGGGASKVGPSPEVDGLKKQVASLQKTVSQLVSQTAPREFTVAQYNILAGYLGDNRQPWFLYGANIPPARRAEIMTKFYQRGEDGKYMNAGWPKCKLPRNLRQHHI